MFVYEKTISGIIEDLKLTFLKIDYLPHFGHVTEVIFLVDFLLDNIGGEVITNLAILPLSELMVPGWAARKILYFFPYLVRL